ncbi:MAG: hypothetical protein WAV50_00435 [Minisyncoccia bacterium]
MINLFEAWQHAWDFSQRIGRVQAFWLEASREAHGNFWKGYLEDLSLFMVAL